MILPVFSLAVFFTGATEFMLSPMLQPLATAFKTTPDKAAWLVSGYALAYALAAPVLGWLSDRVSRHNVLVASLLFLAFDGVALTFAPNLETAIGLRIFGGIASAALVPTIFALVAEILPSSDLPSNDRLSNKQASAMGVVMLGMTAGIATGPVFAGILTEVFNWRIPFLLNAAGCLLLCFLSRKLILTLKNIPPRSPKTRFHAEKTKSRALTFHWLYREKVILPLIAKGFWNGTAVSAFILAGEVLRQHYDLATGAVGVSVSAFGIGLGLGNLSVTVVKRLPVRDESLLLSAVIVLLVACSAFMLLPLSIAFSLCCLMLWGCTLGFAAPVSTSILANRARQNKGQILAISESLNNLVILVLLPIATMQLVRHGVIITMVILGSGLMTGIVLMMKDISVTPSPFWKK
jgi:predicted MFS family arabinose efflux permease